MTARRDAICSDAVEGRELVIQLHRDEYTDEQAYIRGLMDAPQSNCPIPWVEYPL